MQYYDKYTRSMIKFGQLLVTNSYLLLIILCVTNIVGYQVEHDFKGYYDFIDILKYLHS